MAEFSMDKMARSIAERAMEVLKDSRKTKHSEEQR